jgi:FdhE protein
MQVDMTRPDWEKRIRRARDLAAQNPAAAEVLSFYGEVAAFQRKLFDAAAAENLHADPMRPIRDQLVQPAALNRFPALLELVEKKGPAGLAKAARELSQQSPDQWRALLESPPDGEQTQRFFARACLQPVAEYLAFDSKLQFAGYTGALCPACGGKPQLGVLRPEGEGGKRSLLCSGCATEWDFRRILCPNCAEEDHAKLPRYSAEEFPHVRVEACETCRRYLKSVDLTINGLAVPLVDEIAAASLDLWAVEHGYQKIELNLMGL